MTKDEIIASLVILLAQHKAGQRGSVHQEPYKGDLFKLFSEAYNESLLNTTTPNAEYLNAEALTQILQSREPSVLDQEAWRHLYTFWQEWQYAWSKSNLKR